MEVVNSVSSRVSRFRCACRSFREALPIIAVLCPNSAWTITPKTTLPNENGCLDSEMSTGVEGYLALFQSTIQH